VQIDFDEFTALTQRILNRIPIRFRSANDQAHAQQHAFEIMMGDGKFIRMVTTASEQVTATPNPATGRLAGTHVDNRDGLTMRQLVSGESDPPRRAIFTAVGQRALLACFPDVTTMARELLTNGKLESLKGCTGNSVLRRYLQVNPEGVSCIVVPVEVGMALLVPTDLVGHDGTTLAALSGAPTRVSSISFQILEGRG
jgi:hypothetical protein